MTVVRFFLGLALLTSGRNLFWLFLGTVGFILGFDIAQRLLNGQPQGVLFIISLIAGIACALAAILLQKSAILAGGFIAGGYLLPDLLKEFCSAPGHYYWLLFMAGGIVGAYVMLMFFDWTLIVLSSVVGSDLIMRTVLFGPQLRKVLFVFLLVCGVVFQAVVLKKRPRTR